MPIRVLGPAETDDSALPPRERAILAALVSRRGSIVTGDELAQAYWGDGPLPTTWWQQVKTAIARLCRSLGLASIATEERGYRLTAEAGADDATEFQHAVSAAREDRIRGLPERAATEYRRALSLWRGDPYPELDGWMPGRVEAERLIEIRSTVDEELAEVRLELGEHRSLIADAERLVRSEPLREVRWAVLARAQYLSGRQADALATLRQARLRLVSDLGLDPGPELLELETAMLRQDPTLSSAAIQDTSDTCPYRGLTAFGEDDAQVFFGRSAQVEEVLPTVVSGRIVTILGASGNGKSSFVRAGLVPALRAAARKVVFARPDAGLATELRDQVRRLGPDSVIVIDQFEEIVALPETVRDAACAELGKLLRNGVSVVTTLRSDHLDAAIQFPEIGDGIGRGLVALAPLDVSGILEAITRPAAAAGLRLEGGLAELILRDAGERQTVLPHLSHSLVETWLRREGQLLTVEGYIASGGLVGAIAVTAETSFRAMGDSEQAACRATLTRLVERVGDEVLRRRVPVSAFSDDPHRARAVERLVKARLVVIDDDHIVVAHESISHAWPRLSQWLDEDADASRVLRSIADGSRVWDDGGRIDGDLMRGPRLSAGAALRDAGETPLTPLEREFLDASARREQIERDDLATRAAADRQQNRRLRASLVGVGLLLVVALVASVLAVQRGEDAAIAEQEARIDALSATVRDLVDSDRSVASLLAVELYRRYPDDVRSLGALLAVTTDSDAPLDQVTYPADERIFSAPIPGSPRLLVGRREIVAEGGRVTLEIVDFADGTRRTIQTGVELQATPFLGTAVLSDDGRLAVIALPGWLGDAIGDCCRSALLTVDLETGDVVAGPRQVPWLVGPTGAFSPDGSVVALSVPGGVAWLDPLTLIGERPPGAPGEQYDFDLSPRVGRAADGSILVGDAEAVTRWDPLSRTPLSAIDLPGDWASFSVEGLPDGDSLVSGRDAVALLDEEGSVRWSVSARCELAVVTLQQDSFWCWQDDIWEGSLDDGSPTGRRIQPQSARIARTGWLEVLDDGTLVVTNQRNVPTVQRFAIDGSGPGSRLVAAGMAAVDGFVDGVTIPVSSNAVDPWVGDAGPQVLWDVDRDAAVGEPASAIGAIGDGAYLTWQAVPGVYELRHLGSDEVTTLHGGPFDTRLYDYFDDGQQYGDDLRLNQGGAGLVIEPAYRPGLAFAIGQRYVTAFDTATGAAVGKPMLVAVGDYSYLGTTAHEVPGTDSVVITWWNNVESERVTSVVDFTTGEESARGLDGDVASVALPDGTILSVAGSELRRSTLELEPVDSLAKPIGGGEIFELSDTGLVLLISYAGTVAIYDASTGLRLVDGIGVELALWWEAAHLSPDGSTLITNVEEGVVVHDIRPAALAAAACRSAGRELTATEWRGYFGEEPPVDSCALVEQAAS